MPKHALPVSSSLAGLLRERRRQLNLSLRDVEERTREFGLPIPFTTLGKVERAVVDPGAFRLNVLCQIYGIPLQVAGDALDLEDTYGPIAVGGGSTAVLRDEARDAWKSGDLRRAVAILAALRRRTDEPPHERQEGLLHFSIVAGSLGKYQLAKSIVEDLLLEPPDRKLLVRVLIQLAVCWHRLGSGEAALGFLSRAGENLSGDDLQAAYLEHETASVLTTMGRLDAAEERLSVALSLYRKAGNVQGEGVALGVGIRIALAKGDGLLALERAERALDHARGNGLKRMEILRRVDQAKAMIEIRRWDEAIEALDQALAGALSSQDQPVQFHVYHARWTVRRAMGQPRRAALELGAARYVLRYVDENSPEAREVRAASEAHDLN